LLDVNQPSVLFVCLGNICRSPLAEAALRAEAVAAGLAITIEFGGHGCVARRQSADPRAIAEAARHGIDISGIARGRCERTISGISGRSSRSIRRTCAI